MIVETMSFEEVYMELERDRDNVSRWWSHRRDEITRRAMKCNKFPIKVRYEYTSPRYNKYVAMCMVYGKKYHNHNCTVLVALRRVSNGTEIFTSWFEHQKLARPSVLLPHVIERYAERMNVNKSGIDLICHFMERNGYGESSDNQKVIGRSVRYNGEWHKSICTPEGVILGQQKGSIYIARTFITYDMASGLQQSHFEWKRDQILPLKQYLQEANAQYEKSNF